MNGSRVGDRVRACLLFGAFGLVEEEPGGLHAVRLVDAVARDVEAAVRAQRIPELLGGRESDIMV